VTAHDDYPLLAGWANTPDIGSHNEARRALDAIDAADILCETVAVVVHPGIVREVVAEYREKRKAIT
jgi:hypothetical protein